MKQLTFSFAALLLLFPLGCATPRTGGAPPGGPPVFALLIEETVAGKQNAPGSTETEIILVEKLKKAGFRFIDINTPGTGLEKNRTRILAAAETANPADFHDIPTEDLKTDYVIIGITTTTENGLPASALHGTPFLSYSATIRIKAVNLRTGEILAAATRGKPGIGLSKEQASKKAIEKTLSEMIGEVDSTGTLAEGPFTRDLRQSLSR